MTFLVFKSLCRAVDMGKVICTDGLGERSIVWGVILPVVVRQKKRNVVSEMELLAGTNGKAL